MKIALIISIIVIIGLIALIAWILKQIGPFKMN